MPRVTLVIKSQVRRQLIMLHKLIPFQLFERTDRSVGSTLLGLLDYPNVSTHPTQLEITVIFTGLIWKKYRPVFYSKVKYISK